MLAISIDMAGLDKVRLAYETAGAQAPEALSRALNHTGDKARTQVARSLAKQVGLSYGAVKDAMQSSRATPGKLTYELSAKGGAISLKEFGARQTKHGVSAAPWGARRVFPHTFIVDKIGGHVFRRVGAPRLPIKKLWGPRLPSELMKGEAAAAFKMIAERDLGDRISYEIARIMPGGKDV